MIHRFQRLFITHYALFLIILCILMVACYFRICFNFMSIYQMFLPVLSMFLVILLLLFILLECILLLYLMKCRKAHCSFSSFTSIILQMMGLPVGKMSQLLLPTELKVQKSIYMNTTTPTVIFFLVSGTIRFLIIPECHLQLVIFPRCFLAESVGFEPTILLLVCLFSRQVL